VDKLEQTVSALQASHKATSDRMMGELKKLQASLADMDSESKGSAVEGLYNTVADLRRELSELQDVGALNHTLRKRYQYLQSMLEGMTDKAIAAFQAPCPVPTIPTSTEVQEEEEDSGEEGQWQPAKVGAAASAKWMAKPQPFSGLPNEDVDETLFTFQTYFACTGAPKSAWPHLVLTLVSGKARSAWLAFAVPHTHAGNALSWSESCTCMREAFAPPDKEFSALLLFNCVMCNKKTCQ